MARLRYNGLTATLGAALLTADTTITFASALTSAAGSVPTISDSDYIPLAILDADGKPVEIVHLTAYTSGATTGTVTRAQESTTAADQASGSAVVNALTVADVNEKVTTTGTITKLHGPITQAAYDALTPASDTLYVIVG